MKREDANVAMAQILESVEVDIAKLKAKVKISKIVKYKTRITVKFEDKEDRDAARWKVIDQENKYEPPAQYNCEPVEVWTVKPLLEINRDNTLHNAAQLVAHTLGMDKATDLVIDAKTERSVRRKSDGELLVHQDKNDWAPHYTKASGVKKNPGESR